MSNGRKGRKALPVPCNAHASRLTPTPKQEQAYTLPTHYFHQESVRMRVVSNSGANARSRPARYFSGPELPTDNQPGTRQLEKTARVHEACTISIS